MAVLDLEVPDFRLRQNREVGAVKDRPDEGAEGREAFALVLGHVIYAEAELGFGIEIAIFGQAGTAPSLHP